VEQIGTQDYVLKLIWRDPKKEPEGEVLKRLVGIYGLAQWLWHQDVSRMCRCQGAQEEFCEVCVDKTPDQDNVLVCKNLVDLDIEVPADSADGKEVEYRKSSCVALLGVFALTLTFDRLCGHE
jgi:hypothetical protein